VGWDEIARAGAGGGANIFLIDFRRETGWGKLSKKREKKKKRKKKEKRRKKKNIRIEGENLTREPIEVRLKYKMVLRIRRFYVPFQLLSHSTGVFFARYDLSSEVFHYFFAFRSICRSQKAQYHFSVRTSNESL
jgi:hypothetical protein